MKKDEAKCLWCGKGVVPPKLSFCSGAHDHKYRSLKRLAARARARREKAAKKNK